MKHLLFTEMFYISILPGIYSFSQNQNQPELPIDAKIRNEIIDSIFKKLNSIYIFPEIAAQMEKSIQAHNKKDEYNKISSCKFFTDT